MPNQPLNVEGFTVSYAIDTYRNGEKTSHFNSTSIKSTEPLSLDDYMAVRLDAAVKVAIATIQDAVMRMHMTVEEANERITSIKKNYEGLKESLLKQKG